MERAQRGRSWCFTINNYTAEQEAYFTDEFPITTIRYLIVGKETGASGTPHLQGYLTGNAAIERPRVQKLISRNGIYPMGHLTIANGTAEQNKRYCSKETVLIEYGDMPGNRGGSIPITEANPNGLNKQLLAMQNHMKVGLTTVDLYELYGGLTIRYKSGVTEMHNHYLNLLSTKPEPIVFVCWGKPATGKSWWVNQNFGNNKRFTHWVTAGRNNTWWGGYRGQQAVVFDDFEPRHLIQQEMKRMLDHYSWDVEPKGQQVPFTSKYIIFTCNSNPNTWYRNPDILNEADDDHFQAIQRRLGTIQHFTQRFKPDPNYNCGFLPHEPEYMKKLREIRNINAVTDQFEKPPSLEVADDVTDMDTPSAAERFIDELAGASNDSEGGEKAGKQKKKPAPSRPRKRCRFVDDQAGCSDDDDDEEEDEEEELFCAGPRPV